MVSENQFISVQNGVSLYVKREDLLHPLVSGNKFRKLKYNLIQAKTENKNTILTFGGAFSNHIAATAFAAAARGFKSVGIIRGDELEEKIDKNPTLAFAKNCGMELEYISRKDYRLKESPEFINKLRQKFGEFYLLPEGGTNQLAVKGCEEILSEEDSDFDFICCAAGTGGTISGLINSAKPHQKILGFPALKGDFLQNEIRIFAANGNWELIRGYDFGGYGKVGPELIGFINSFFEKYKVPADPVYTGKLFFGVMDLIQKNYFPEGSKILMIHTGGLQGIAGMNLKLAQKQLPTININV